MNKSQISDNFIHGNYREVWNGLLTDRKASDERLIGRAFDVYQHIRGQYGATVALSFSNWLQKNSDL